MKLEQALQVARQSEEFGLNFHVVFCALIIAAQASANGMGLTEFGTDVADELKEFLEDYNKRTA